MQERLLSVGEQKRRESILSGNLWQVVIAITLPLTIYALFNYFYGFIDFLLVSRIGTDDVGAVFFIGDVVGAIQAIGGGIAIAGSVFVARHYGAGEFKEAKRYAGVTLTTAFLLASIVALLMIAFGKPLLVLMNATPEILAKGMGYYVVQMATTVLIAINAVFMGVERAKGNTRAVMSLNLVAMAVKIALTYLFVVVLSLGTLHVGIATMIAQGMLTLLGLRALFSKKSSIALTKNDLSWDFDRAKEILIVALPVIGGKFLFSVGRVIVNGMAAVYGTTAIAAFGLGSKLIGGPGAVALVFEETTASMSSQNIGAGKLKRAFQTYGIANLYSALLGFAGMFLVMAFVDTMIPWFSTNTSPEFAPLVKSIFAFEKFSAVSSATIGIVAGLFIGFKITKMTLVLNVIRVYVFRIPALFLFQLFGTGPIALGYVMFISNSGTAIVSLLFLVAFFLKVKNYGYLDLRYERVA
jgi:putative MATE family efflux protein